MSKGKFITFEGGEGTGKSTQVEILVEALRKAGHPSIPTREPGGSRGAEEIRTLLVNGETSRWTAMSEALLNYAARADHMDKTIKPALEKGAWVVSDRFSDSTLAYQGYGHGLELYRIKAMHEVTLGAFYPDLTLIFDLPLEIGLARAADRGDGEDRYERMGHDFHERLRKGFLEIAASEKERCVTIDASGDIEQTAGLVKAAVRERLGVEFDDE